ncbi:hypothetical protein MMC10_007525 [Thelotrema lepadinum]|nr:hypothetical protein [Thelotrema lepadinum]
MHAVAGRLCLASSNLALAKPCRFIAGRRFSPSSTRSFHTCLPLRRSQDDPTDNPAAALNHVRDLPDQEALEVAKEEHSDASDTPNNGALSPASGPPNGSGATTPEDILKVIHHYGSRMKRSSRNNRKTKEFQVPVIPDWFITRNVLLHEAGQPEPSQIEIFNGKGASRDDQGELSTKGNEEEEGLMRQTQQDAPEGTWNENEAEPENVGANESKYKIEKHIYDEISALVLSGLQVANSPRSEDASISKPHIVLQSPKAGATKFLTSLAETVAHRSGADVINLDTQDIAEIAGGHAIGPVKSQDPNRIRSLGYDVHIVDSDMEGSAAEDEEATEEGYEDGEEESSFPKMFPQNSAPSKPPRTSPSSWKYGFSPVSSMLKGLSGVKLLFPAPMSNSSAKSELPSGPKNIPPNSTTGKSESEIASEKKALLDISQSRMVFDAILDAPLSKRYAQQILEEAAAEAPAEKGELLPLSDVVVILQDYLELQTTQFGADVLDWFHGAISERRKFGQRVLIIGVSEAEDLLPSMSKNGFRKIQTEARGPYRTVITTLKNKDAESILKEDEKARIRHVNVRHLQDMVRRLSPELSPVKDFVSQETTEIVFDSAKSFSWGLNECVWSMDRVHRVVSVALGLVGPQENMDSSHLSSALETIRESDESKFAWLKEENERQPKEQINASAKSTAEGRKIEQEERMKRLRKTCNTHERKLLNGVIDASTLTTTFTDVRAPPSTIEALKTLTSLSLIRPDAFTYGVLATDKIPGLLLYGPPGTGKTLLAKAVSKESGATVLEVSGSDIYDMYVGEGEKNVRALFTLARKLSPCVVFIDEADAIFGSRNNSGNRTSHRELINQFLREWDGMASAKAAAFIMVATNRPFDLDDAVLRRLPRRLLVDLPTKEDREAILKIHLKDEVLDAEVSLADLADKTPFYSGSDLKNLSVAAALACVKAENEAAAAAGAAPLTDAMSAPTPSFAQADPSQPLQPYTFPARRTLIPAHFEKALSEISASISEDMSSLAAIRKFDEKYGDRRGRRKSKGMGFGLEGGDKSKEGERERERERERRMEEEVRVRRDTEV